MKIEIRSANEAIIEGYVNAVGRDSRMLPSIKGNFIEQVKPKTFERAMSKTDNIELRFNHNKVIGSTKDNLTLREDNIGLYAKAIITDADTINKAKNNELRGWSFGFVVSPNGDEWEDTSSGIQRRYLNEIELREVSILDKTPAYIGTSIEMRDSSMVEYRCIDCCCVMVDCCDKAEDKPEDKTVTTESTTTTETTETTIEGDMEIQRTRQSQWVEKNIEILKIKQPI